MSALAKFFVKSGCFVAGYDLTKTVLTDDLSKIGVLVNYDDAISIIPEKIINEIDSTLVIYTPAVPKTNKQLNYFIDNKYKVLKRAEVLGLLSSDSKTIAVAGTHGKTSISSLITHILKVNNALKAGFVGGIIKNYNSNFIFGDDNDKKWLVLEADEFDRSFHKLNPEIAVISSTDADHLDIYGDKNTFKEAFDIFASKTKQILITHKNVNVKFPENIKHYSYVADDLSDFYATNIRVENQRQLFDIVYPDGVCKDVSIKLPGKVNVENSTVAFAVSFLTGTQRENIKKALATFDGVQRRFDIIVQNDKFLYINDYAHHPTEIDNFREAVRQICPDKKLTAVFQPHLFSRTRDFADGFAESLGKFDEIFLLDIYPARELPVEGVSSKMIFDKISNKNKFLCSMSNVLEIMESHNFEVLLTIGAGDILNIVEPLKNIIIKKYNK